MSAAMQSPFAEYFEVFLASRLNQPLLADAQSLCSRFGVLLRGQPEQRWSVEVRHGVLTAVARNGFAPECEFTIDGVPTFLEIVSAKVAPQQAFFEQRVEIGGDIELGLKTVATLAQFFREQPFAPTTG